jgi:hypothetical protein
MLPLLTRSMLCGSLVPQVYCTVTQTDVSAGLGKDADCACGAAGPTHMH